jgi:hypothetical protein
MAISKMKYIENKGFWISESFMQLTWHYVLQEIIKPQYNFVNKQDLIEDFQQDIDGIHAGYLGLMWDNDIENASEEQTMIQVLQKVKITLQNKGAFISIQEQKTIQTKDHTLEYMLGKKPFPTAELIRVIDALIQMLQGTWESTNYNMDLNWRLYE